MKNKTLDWLFGITLIVTLFIAPLLFTSWRQEKQKADLYQKEFFYLWEQIEEIKNHKTTAEKVLEYLNEKKERADMINWLADKINDSR